MQPTNIHGVIYCHSNAVYNKLYKKVSELKELLVIVI